MTEGYILKGIDGRMTADLLDTLMRMGHGAELVLADSIDPAHFNAAATATGRIVDLPGFSAPEAIAPIRSVMPLDAVAPAGALWMQSDGQGDRPEPVHRDARAVIAANLPEDGGTASPERQAIHGHVRKAFAVVRRSDDRPCGCFASARGSSEPRCREAPDPELNANHPEQPWIETGFRPRKPRHACRDS